MANRSYSELFLARKGLLADKWAQYLPVYDREITRFLAAGRPIRLLEIGIARGGSLAIWEALLPPDSSIIGLDIEPGCGDLPFGPAVRVIILDATDRRALDQALGDAVFDIIIDDGSHRSPDIIATFDSCFRRLAPGGIYIVEDLHAAYWPSFGGRYRDPGSAIEFLKTLVDALHADHFLWEKGISHAERAHLTAHCAEVARVAFHDSIAVIERMAVPKDGPHPRIASGGEGELPGTGGREAPDQAVSSPAAGGGDAILTQALLRARVEITGLRQQVASLQTTAASPASAPSTPAALRARIRAALRVLSGAAP